jgi:plastocyanin
VVRRTLVVGLAAVALGLAACGDDDTTSDTGAAAATTPAATTGATGARLQIAADPGGDLAYDKTSLSASAGAVQVDFTNESSVPHNVVIETSGEDVGATDTVTGSSTSKTFELDAGSYTYYCSVGSHRQAGMEGTLTVR